MWVLKEKQRKESKRRVGVCFRVSVFGVCCQSGVFLDRVNVFGVCCQSECWSGVLECVVRESVFGVCCQSGVFLECVVRVECWSVLSE